MFNMIKTALDMYLGYTVIAVLLDWSVAADYSRTHKVLLAILVGLWITELIVHRAKGKK